MSDVRDRYLRVAAGFGARLSGVGGELWAAPTPCGGWDARALVAHVIGVHSRVLELVDPATLSERPQGELAEQWRWASGTVADCLADCRRDVTVGAEFGEQSLESFVSGVLCADTLVHSWDLARATGQDERLDDWAVAEAWRFLEPCDELIRVPGGFEAKVEPPPGADLQTQLLAFCGRRVV
jgi:uncharacterized protein (TIGR03086 family)